ncbi:hypothetical protein Q8A73_001734 [Channa argus]|nr:hypothetical protein Q8A73_001734 [Channa argus]
MAQGAVRMQPDDVFCDACSSSFHLPPEDDVTCLPGALLVALNLSALSLPAVSEWWRDDCEAFRDTQPKHLAETCLSLAVDAKPDNPSELKVAASCSLVWRSGPTARLHGWLIDCI